MSSSNSPLSHVVDDRAAVVSDSGSDLEIASRAAAGGGGGSNQHHLHQGGNWFPHNNNNNDHSRENSDDNNNNELQHNNNTNNGIEGAGSSASNSPLKAAAGIPPLHHHHRSSEDNTTTEGSIATAALAQVFGSPQHETRKLQQGAAGGRLIDFVRQLAENAANEQQQEQRDPKTASAHSSPMHGSSTGDGAIMNFTFDRSAKSKPKEEVMYPFNPLRLNTVSYRGYPMDGPKELKNTDWRIQIVGANMAPPHEALPQFPQQELLKRVAEDEYVGQPGVRLSEQQVAFNSGRAYLSAEQPGPTSHSFFTSGYNVGSAAEVLKPFSESIYDAVVSGAPVEVATLKE